MYMKMSWAFKKSICTRHFVGCCEVMRDCLGLANGIFVVFVNWKEDNETF